MKEFQEYPLSPAFGARKEEKEEKSEKQCQKDLKSTGNLHFDWRKNEKNVISLGTWNVRITIYCETALPLMERKMEVSFGKSRLRLIK